MTSPAQQFNKSPIQKYGVQAEKPPRVTMWRSNEKFDSGTSVLIKNFRTMDQLEKKMAQQLKLMPALYGLYTIRGQRLRELTDIVDGSDVVAVPTGHKFNAEKLPQALQKKIKDNTKSPAAAAASPTPAAASPTPATASSTPAAATPADELEF